MSGHPSVAEVVALYASAAAGPPLFEPRRFAETYGRVYESAISRGVAITAAVRGGPGDLRGFAYGEPWRWAEDPDAWERELRDRVGVENALLMADSMSINLLAVAPPRSGEAWAGCWSRPCSAPRRQPGGF